MKTEDLFRLHSAAIQLELIGAWYLASIIREIIHEMAGGK